MSRRRNSRSARNEEGRQALLRKVVLLETASFLLVPLPLFVGGVVPAVGLVLALALQLDVACVAFGED
jgi:hypothetical protein